MLRSPGLRLSFIGGIIFLLSAIALIFLPRLLAAMGMIVGGMGVWVGFLWTLFSYYGPSSSGGS